MPASPIRPNIPTVLPSTPPTPPPPTQPSAEQLQSDAIDSVFSARSRRSRPRGPDAAGDLARAFRFTESHSMAVASLSSRAVGVLARASGDDAQAALVRHGVGATDAGVLVGELRGAIETRLRVEIRTAGRALIAERRATVQTASDALAAIRNAPEGAPLAILRDALSSRFGADSLETLAESFDDVRSHLDNYERRLEADAWQLSEMPDAAREFAPAGWVQDGSLAEQVIGRASADVVGAAVMTVEAGHGLHASVELMHALGHLPEAAAEAVGGGLAVIGAAAGIAAHMIAHHAHEDFVEGMNGIFEAAR